jgi:hypothetical protein
MSKDQATTTTTIDVKDDPTAEHQGEVQVNKKARADVVGEVSAKEDARNQEENIENAKQDALRNHAAEQQS